MTRVFFGGILHLRLHPGRSRPKHRQCIWITTVQIAESTAVDSSYEPSHNVQLSLGNMLGLTSSKEKSPGPTTTGPNVEENICLLISLRWHCIDMILYCFPASP
jgi:hypothetical protein